MDRRDTVLALLALGAAPFAAEAQQAAKVARIGYLTNHVASSPHLPEAFRQGLRDLGYVEGRNVVIEYRDAEGKLERLPALAAELVALKVDVIVASAYPGTLAAKNATNTIPVIMVAVADPVRIGLIASLVRPGGNITGLTLLAGTEIVGKHLELLKEAVPNLSRVAVLWNPANPMHVLRLREVEVAGLDVTEVTQSLTEGLVQVGISSLVDHQVAYSRDLGRLLGLGDERHGQGPQREPAQERAPVHY